MDWKKIGKRLLFPPIWITIILTILSIVGLAVVFLKSWDTSPVAYCVYVMSAYITTVLCVYFVLVFPGRYKEIKERVHSIPLAHQYLTDHKFKTHVNLYASLTVNLLYVAMNIFLGIRHKTAWFLLFATYYGVMAIVRFILLRYSGKNVLGEDLLNECRRARICAFILMTLNIMLSGAVLMMVYSGRGFKYQGVMIYVMAMYAFYVTTMAIVNLVRYRKYNSPVMLTSKAISLAAALVSMLSLETAMFAHFGQDTSPMVKELMIMLTGGGIAIIVVVMSVFTIIRTTKLIKKL